MPPLKLVLAVANLNGGEFAQKDLTEESALAICGFEESLVDSLRFIFD